jgi:hypothetical protein
VDSSISNTGRPSRTGYTRWHAVHFKDSGLLFNSRSFLHAGQTIRSRRYWGIMMEDCTTPKKHFHHGGRRKAGQNRSSLGVSVGEMVPPV